jgi:endogenous inhibitor of DNA gyrase (YacG/DUF329 family)
MPEHPTPPSTEATAARRTVRCPTCGGASLYAPTNPYRPFCSARCRQIDLGAWAAERYSVPEATPDRDPDFETH